MTGPGEYALTGANLQVLYTPADQDAPIPYQFTTGNLLVQYYDPPHRIVGRFTLGGGIVPGDEVVGWFDLRSPTLTVPK